MGDKLNQNRADVQQQGEREHAAGALYAEADLSKPANAGGKGAQIDVEGTYGSEGDFLKSAPKELRQSLGLKADATSDQIYHKMAQDLLRAFPRASAELQQEALDSLGVKRSDLAVTNQSRETTVYNALIARDRRETGTAAGASLSDLETAVHKRTYKQMKDGTLPIDYD